jgi:RHS repeat-associated protein
MDDPSDGVRVTLIDYATDSTGRIRNAPSRVRLYGAAPPTAQLRDTRLYYDYATTNGSVSAGLLTQREQINLGVPGTDAVTRLVYDAAGRLTSVINPRESAGEIATGYGTRSFSYTASGLPDLVSETRSAPYQTQGAVLRLTTTTSYIPDTSCAVAMPAMAGLPAIVTDPNGTRTILCYDAYGRLLSQTVKNSAGVEVARSTLTYVDTPASATTSPTVTISETLNATQSRSETLTLDGLGRTILSALTGPGTMTIQRSTTYDALGRVASQSLPGNGAPGALTTFAYDGLGREISRTAPGTTAAVTRYAIDGTRLRIDVLAPDNNGAYSQASETRYLSDAFGNVVEVREMAGSASSPTLYASTTYTYDGADLLKEIRDHHGNKTTFAYDGLGRRITLTDPDTGLWMWLYDRNGNVTFQDGPRTGDTLTYQYDLLGRITQLTRTGPGTSKTFTYDFATNGLGRFWKEREGDEGFGVVAYDALGRPTAEQAVAAGKQFDFATTYNRVGDVLTRTYPTGRVVTYARDARGFVTGVTTGSDTYATSVSWHHSLRLASWTAGNGIVTTYGYNATTQLPSTFNAGGVENITSYTYKPDYRLAATTGTTASSFDYDDLGRLTRATGPYNTGYAQTTLYYGYDPIGNLTCMDASAVPSGTTCTNGKLFTYPAANPSNPPARPHAPTAISGQASPTFDAAGNMLTGNGRTYTYDPEGKAASIASGGTTLTATYAGDGKAWKITAGGVTRYRIFDDFEWNQTAGLARTSVFLDGQIIAITEESFTPTTYGGCGQVWPEALPQPAAAELALLLLYGLGGALAFPMARVVRRHAPRTPRAWAALGTSGVFVLFVSVPPQLVAVPAAAAAPANTTFLHPDRLGSSLVVSNNTGTASAKRVVYRPFGTLVQNSGGTSTVPERGFTGQRFEPSIGVYDYNARWYDPAIARFVQPDPILQGALNPQQFNPLSYLNNDPPNLTDTSGLGEVGNEGLEEIVIIGQRIGCIGCMGGVGIFAGGLSGAPSAFFGLGGFLIDIKFNFYAVGGPRDPNRQAGAAQTGAATQPTQDESGNPYPGVEEIIITAKRWKTMSLSQDAIRRLAAFFPDLDLSKVIVHNGVPERGKIFIERIGDNVVLGYNEGDENVYIREGELDFDDAASLALVAHELVHWRQGIRHGVGRFRRLYLFSSSERFSFEAEANAVQQAAFQTFLWMQANGTW